MQQQRNWLWKYSKAYLYEGLEGGVDYRKKITVKPDELLYNIDDLGTDRTILDEVHKQLEVSNIKGEGLT